MKFKKVEIQAFRAYDKAKDGTFDFTRQEDGRSADFISLYAPNGFGKTSFYDAVEYGITNNIDRFLRKGNGKDAFNSVKSERNIRSKKRQYFLRNNYSDDNLPTYIKLYKVGEENPVVTNIVKPKTKAGYDYKFDPNVTINKEFKTVILSQEWIDAFLKEDKPEDRYERFIEYFGDKKIDDYYKKINSLIVLNNKKIEGLLKVLNGIQLELKFDGDKNILKKINEKILSLNKAGESLKKIDKYFNEIDALSLSNIISERISDIEFEINKINEHIKYLDIFLIGNDKVDGMSKYFELKSQIAKLDKLLAENNTILAKFVEKQKLTNESYSIKKLNDELSTNKQILESLKIDFNDYEIISKDLTSNRLKYEDLKKEISAISIELNLLEQSEVDNIAKLTSLQKQISDLEKLLSETPKLKESLDNTTERLQNSNIKRLNVETKITSLEREKDLLEVYIDNLKSSIREINDGIYPSVSDISYSVYEKISGEIKRIDELISTETKVLNEINYKIDASEKFQKEIEQFISKGSEIVNSSQTSTCPLCEQQYESFSELATKISNNIYLSSVLSNLLNERNVKLNNISLLNESLKINRKSLVTEFAKVLENTELKHSTILGDIKKYSDLKLILTKEIEYDTTTLDEIYLKLNGKTIEIFENEMFISLSELRINYESLVKINIELKNSIISESLKLNIAKDTMLKISMEIDRIIKEVVYLRVNEYFKANYPGNEINLDLVINELSRISISIKSNVNRDIKLKKEIEDLYSSLLTYNDEEIRIQNEHFKKTVELYTKAVTSFEQEVKSKLGIELNEYSFEQFRKYLEDKKNKCNEDVGKLEFKVKEYNLLEKLKINVIPFLKYENAKTKEKDCKARIQFLKSNITKKLSNELKSVADFLTRQIDSFFYESLINELYRKIDPHPDYKTVTFKCDFTDNKPKLNVCVYHEKKDEIIIPNLYFSTAQLNILSLSIFLAKALNAKDHKGNPIECIFIDDPIQSMDSINILSTIDLLRSIVVNYKKQIILSTHDENFHNLLKKKMPSSLFNSKYMELETFGKVKINDD